MVNSFLVSNSIMMASNYIQEIFSLNGKTAILTGATGGLGSAMAVSLAKAGAFIVSIELPNDPNSATLAQAVSDAGSTLQAFHCDLGNAEQLRSCFSNVWAAGIVPDILVNSAGVMRRNACEDATDDELNLVRLLFNFFAGVILV
jgi:2-deoxy-D-gluconate 3-dehydrogenase